MALNYYNLYYDKRISFEDIPMSAINKEIIELAFFRNESELKDVVSHLCDINEANVMVIASSILSDEPRKMIYEILVDKNPKENFYFVPSKLLTLNMCKRVFELDPEKYFPLIPEKFITGGMCQTLFKINPELYFFKIPKKRITSGMCKKMFELNPEKYFAIIPNGFITKEMCDKMFALDPEKFFGKIPASYLTEEMCKKMFKRNPEKFFEQIPKSLRTKEMCDEMFALDPEKYFAEIPNKLKTQEMCDKVFALNPDKFFEVIPNSLKTQEMCNKYLSLGPSSNIFRIPEHLRTKEMWELAFQSNPSYIFSCVPAAFKTQEMCQTIFELDNSCFYMIPEHLKTQEMCNKMFELKSLFVFSSIPKHLRTKEMYDYAFQKNPDFYFQDIPDNLKTLEMCKTVIELDPRRFFYQIPEHLRTSEIYGMLLKKDFLYFSRIIPEDMIDVEMIGIAKIEMDKMIAAGQLINKGEMSKLMGVVIKLYPDCEKIVQFTMKDRIKKELYSLVDAGGSIDLIAKKYDVSITVVNGILERLKDEDAAGYERIKGVLESNQRTYFFQVMKDAGNLSTIVDYLGNIDFRGISLEQKLKFSYLCNKYLAHDLEEIYGFNFDKYSSKDYSNIKKFFNRVLKYNFINSDYTTIPEKKTIKFNNSWFRNYNTERFFAIKDGKPTMEHRYGKNSELLTLEIEDKIVNALKFEGIPLTEVLVTTAFKEYFNGNLSGYIEKVNGFSTEFEQFKSKKASSEDDKGTIK